MYKIKLSCFTVYLFVSQCLPGMCYLHSGIHFVWVWINLAKHPYRRLDGATAHKWSSVSKHLYLHYTLHILVLHHIQFYILNEYYVGIADFGSILDGMAIWLTRFFNTSESTLSVSHKFDECQNRTHNI